MTFKQNIKVGFKTILLLIPGNTLGAVLGLFLFPEGTTQFAILPLLLVIGIFIPVLSIHGWFLIKYKSWIFKK